MKFCLSTTVKLAFLSLFCPIFLSGQNLENIGSKKGLQLNGGLNFQTRFYSVSGIDPRQQPFYWSVSGSPTLNIYGVQIPFYLLLSNQERRFQQPFNQIGIAPYYKWAKFYLGYNNVRFSPYTLAGRRFLGVGTELNPGLLRLGFVYGRFQRAISEMDPVSQPTQSYLSTLPIPAYDRKGFAAKVGLGNALNYLDLSLLHIQDDPQSIVEDSVKAEENLALGLDFQVRLFSLLTWKTEAGISAFTRNQLSDSIPIPDIPVLAQALRFFPPKFSTQIRTAVESSLALKGKSAGIQLGFRRIDKDYKSMGAYYFLTDVQEWTISPNFNLLKNRLQVHGTIGLQRDNLNEHKAQTTRRLIGSGQLSYQPNARFGIHAQYANFGISQNPVQRSITDTTRLEQVNQNLSILPRLTFATASKVQSLTLVLGYHALSDQSTGISYTSEMKSWFGQFNYHLNLIASGWSIQAGLNGQRVLLEQGQTESLGFNSSLSKTALKGKLSLHLAYAWFHNRFQQQANGYTQNIRLNAHWDMAQRHRLQVQLRQLFHHAPLGGPHPSFRESQGTLSYLFHFN